MTVSQNDVLVGTCPICEINVYDRPGKNKPFMEKGKEKLGYPRDIAMPCGLNRTEGRCPFETEKEQQAIEYKKGVGIFSGENNWDSAT